MKKSNLNVIMVAIVIFASMFIGGCDVQTPDASAVAQNQESIITDSGVKADIDWLFQHAYLPKDKYDEWNRSGAELIYAPNGDIGYPVGDIIYSREYIKIMKQKLQGSKNARMRIQSTLYAGGTMKVRIHSTVPYAWTTAISDACTAWNALGYNVKFAPYSTTSPSDNVGELDIYYASSGGAGVYASTWSVLSTGGSEFMYINTSYNGTLPSVTAKKQIIIHELGHAIGFGHSDSYDGIAANPYIACNGYVDASSFMHDGLSPTAPYTGFDTCDKSNIDYYW